MPPRHEPAPAMFLECRARGRRGAAGSAIKGHCPCYAALGISTVNRTGGAPVNLPIRVEDAVTVQSGAHDLYRLWRDFRNLPRVMENLESVDVLDDRRSHWVAPGAHRGGRHGPIVPDHAPSAPGGRSGGLPDVPRRARGVHQGCPSAMS